MPYAPPRHGQKRVEAERKASAREYNHNRRTGGEEYNRKWRKVRNWFFKANPLCAACKAEGFINQADVVDHIIPLKNGGDRLSHDNLQSLCHRHHNQKSAHESGQGFIHVLIGPPCAGKSTLAQAEIKKRGGIVVDFDLLCVALGASDNHNVPEAIKDIAVKARWGAIQAILKGIESDAWIIETTPSRLMIDYYKKQGAHFKLVDPGQNVCLERAAENRPGDTLEIINKWYRDKNSLISKVFKGQTPDDDN